MDPTLPDDTVLLGQLALLSETQRRAVAQRYHICRLAVIETVSLDYQAATARRFFADLEASTFPELFLTLGTEKRAALLLRKADIQQLMIQLAGRISLRRAGAVLEPVKPHHVPAISRISELLRRICARHFSGLKSMERAVEGFANGSLRVLVPEIGVWTTQPSSFFYFYFGEFGLLCLDARVDARFWQRFTNVLVRSQRIFLNTYRPSSGPWIRAAFTASNYCPDAQFDEAALRELRVCFANMAPADLSAAASDHVRYALRDE